MSTRMRSDAQKFTHDNYATSTTMAVKTLPKNSTSVLIDNMDASVSVLVSFDGGINFKTVLAGRSLSFDCDNLISYGIKSASATPSVECLYGSEA